MTQSNSDNNAVIARLERQQNELVEDLRQIEVWSDDYNPEQMLEKIGLAAARVLDNLANLYSEPERKKDNDMTHDYDRNIHTNPDHEAWADFFIQTWPNGCADRDTMAGWFANAMMAKADSMTSEKPKQPAVPVGWKLVPVEPSIEMIKAADKADNEAAIGNYGGSPESTEIWSVMVDAAPQPSQQGGRE